MDQKFMKAVAVTGKDKVEIIHDLPVPEVGEYEALVKIKSCGFCNGTDFHIINGSLTKGEGMGEYPTILGHEGCGDIVEVGSKVRHLKIGDRFIRPNTHGNAGRYSMTYGNMSEYGLVCDHQAMLEDGWEEKDLPFYGRPILGFAPNFAQIPNEIDPIDGGVVLSLVECFGAVKDFGIGEGHSVLVYGCGPMGLASMRIMKALGVKRIVAIDGVEDRLDTALNVIAVDQVINFKNEDVAEVLKGEEFDFVYDAVGSTKIIEDGSHFLKAGGKVCGLGVLSVGQDMLNLHNMKNNTSIQVHMQPHKRFSFVPEVCQMILDGKLNPKDYYSHVLPMEDVEKAMELVRTKQCLKVILTL